MKVVWDALTHLCFPALCVHCQQSTPHHQELLCSSCKELLHFLVAAERCSTCFALLEQEGMRRCRTCQEKSSSLKRRAAAFEYAGPAAALVHQLKFAHRLNLAKDLAAFMVVQLFRLGWEVPDLLIPVPQPFTRFLTRGFNQSLLIAQEMATLLERPYGDLLRKSCALLPQTGQGLAQRESLAQNAFSWKKRRDLSDQRILLVDDVCTTGTTLQRCAAVLQEGFPAAISGFTFCLASA